MKITLDNIGLVNFTGLVLVFYLKGESAEAAKLHAKTCRVARADRRWRIVTDTNVEADTRDVLERGYGVTLCRCASSAMTPPGK